MNIFYPKKPDRNSSLTQQNEILQYLSFGDAKLSCL